MVRSDAAEIRAAVRQAWKEATPVMGTLADVNRSAALWDVFDMTVAVSMAKRRVAAQRQCETHRVQTLSTGGWYAMLAHVLGT